jgi:hypothetical protein
MTEKNQYKIAVLLPTRGRTDALARSIMGLFNRAVDPQNIHLMLGFDNDDQSGIEHFQTEIQPWLDKKDINYDAIVFEPMGYTRLNEYVNALALATSADWYMFWNDDAIMETTGWDREINKHTGEFKLLAVHTHRDHPYSIFPIAPREWLLELGYLSPHQISDAWLSQQAYILNIFERIPVLVTHDRHDLTGNNDDATYKNRIMYEGQPTDPKDFHHVSWHMLRMNEAEKLSKHMISRGINTEWWNNVKTGKQYPWEKLVANDTNSQMKQFSISLPKL